MVASPLWNRLTMASRGWTLAVLAGVAALSFHWIHGFCGPYRILVEWQLRRSGTYSMEHCAALTILAAVTIGVLPFSLLAALGWIRTRDTTVPAVISPDPSESRLEPLDAMRGLSLDLRRHNEWLRSHKFRLVFLGVGLTGIGKGVWFLFHYWQIKGSATPEAAATQAFAGILALAGGLFLSAVTALFWWWKAMKQRHGQRGQGCKV